MFTADHLRAYREAAGWAVQFEFLIRAITPALWSERSGRAKDLKAMFDDIVAELKPHIPPADLEDLTTVNLCDLRDDIVHARFSKAFGKLGGKSNHPSVARVMTLVDGEDLASQLVRMAQGGGSPIPSTKTETGGVSIWLTQMAESGFLADAVRAFHSGCRILDAGLEARAAAILGGETPEHPRGT